MPEAVVEGARLHRIVTSQLTFQLVPRTPHPAQPAPRVGLKQILLKLRFSCPRDHVQEDAGRRSCSRHSERALRSPVPAAEAKGVIADHQQRFSQLPNLCVSVLSRNPRPHFSHILGEWRYVNICGAGGARSSALLSDLQ